MRDARVLAEIRAIHREHRDYGSPRMTAELARRGVPCNHKMVEALMRRGRVCERVQRSLRHGDV